jgi:hypothetical protein
MKNPEKYECGRFPEFHRLCERVPHKTGGLAGMIAARWAKKKNICVFTATRPTLIFASDPMPFYTEFG